MGSRRAVVFLTTLALASCGSDDGGSEETTETVDSALAIQQDTEAKMDARTLVTLVETCYVDRQDYSRCVDAGKGEDVGQASVEAPSDSHFVVTAPSESGNEFSVGNTEGGTLARNCTEPGTGGCADDGSW